MWYLTAGRSDDLEAFVCQLITEAHELLGDIIEKTRDSDTRAKRSKADWSERHRLHVMLEAANDTLKRLPNSVGEPWFLAELAGTLQVIKKWSNKSNWHEIKPSLATATHFNHTVSKLYVAEYFEKLGHKVEIVPRGEESSPDLKIEAFRGRGDWVSIECYQPRILNGKRKNLSESELRQIIKHAMGKAKQQIGKKSLGILAITCFNQPKVSLNILLRSVQERLTKTGRANILGIMLVSFSMLVRQENANTTFEPIYTVDLVSNPSYFGSVDVNPVATVNDSGTIYEPITDYEIGDNIVGKIAQAAKDLRPSEPTTASVNIKPKTNPLRLLSVPDHDTRVIFLRKGNDRQLPFFSGNGNANFKCGKCSSILAERVWVSSFSNVIMLCPCCSSYNEFPSSEIHHPVKGAVTFLIGNYEFDGTIPIMRGICLVGVDLHPNEWHQVHPPNDPTVNSHSTLGYDPIS